MLITKTQTSPQRAFSFLEVNMKTAELLSLTKSLKADTREIYFRNREEKAFNSSWEDQELACRSES